ncbi:MAG: divergent PAP2 family protein [Bacteroides sp.]|nr:divergent PAP2 family protein [Eubacterium sp.]MCM1418945.1 divergent PAP2 family protein [Roseburia sp.]MCM1462111.1 divergent PAP2 family protein [Bacteroides sp.]
MRTDQFNVVLIAAGAAWLSAQIIKTLLFLAKYKKFNAERIVGAGGMPSSHSAFVCALSIMTSRVCGVTSTEFALAMALALVVMYDACGVRREAGQHAREINRLRKVVDRLDDETIEKINDELDVEEELEDEKELKELLGHTPFQVTCGALLGIIIGMALPVTVV